VNATRLAGRVNLLGPWLRARFGRPVVKLPLDAGLSCPVRDGTIARAPCAFCPPSGSGRGQGDVPIARQIEQALARLEERSRRRNKPVPLALAYFQAYTTTHTSAHNLRRILEPACRHPRVAGLIVSTRPDCLDPARWQVLEEAARTKPMWLELGLQSAHDQTLAALGRGHDVACFQAAAAEARARGIPVVAHVILGLPGEGPEHTAATAEFLARLGVWGVKMHNLMVLAGSRLAGEYTAGRLSLWSREQWAAAAAEFLARLRPETLVHRLVADPGPDRLLAPDWAGDKDRALTALAEALEARDLRQGALWKA